MDTEKIDIKLNVIGRIVSDLREPVHRDDWTDVIAGIEINPDYSQALDSLEEFSHIIIVYWLHRQPDRDLSLKVHPRGDRAIPEKGLFATRSPHRPNPVGISTVRLLERQGSYLKVSGLDAIDGTPVIDIKPYIPGYDTTGEVGVPPWVRQR
jgi:tRNA-Thr(GGU) m(6)t(6)A37 methyltransferase TsaA